MADIRDQHENARKALQNEIQNLNKLKIDYSLFKKTPSEQMEASIVKSRYNENLRRLGFNPKKRMNADLEFLADVKKLLGVPMV
jgi:hypothetical protein